MKKSRFVLACVALSVAFVALFSSSLAWFSSVGLIDPSLGFSAGSPEDYQVFRISYADETSAQTIEQTDEIGTDFTVEDLPFGTISNLSYLENSNHVYYAIRVPKEHGATVNLGVSFGDADGDGMHFKIYVPEKENGEIVRDENENIVPILLEDTAKLASIEAIETDDETFISYAMAISASAPEAFGSIDAMNALFTEEMAPLSKVNADGTPVQSATGFDVSGVGDYYYVYIKLVPNIDLYKYFVDYLWDNMPFCLAYEIRVMLTVTP